MRTRRTRNAVATVLAAGLMAVVNPVIAHAQSPQSSDPTPLTSSSIRPGDISGDISFAIMNQNSRKFLQPEGGSNAVGAKIVQQPPTGGFYQQWRLILDGNFTTFWNDNSLLNLGIDRASTSPGAVAIQAKPSNDTNQDWLRQPPSTNMNITLINRNSGLCLGISGASTADGAQAAQFPCDGKINQRWTLVPLGR